MELRNLYSFLRIAELGSFSRAAELLGYAQSTVSMQIRQLEEEVGFPLFERIGKKVYLTAQGREMMKYANQMVCLDEQIHAIGNDPSRGGFGILRIGVVESIMNTSLVNILKEYRKTCPGVLIQIRPAVTFELMSLLSHNEIDMAFTIGDPADLPEYICAGSNREKAVFAVSEEHPLSRKESVSLKEVFSQEIITNANNTYLQHRLNKLAISEGLEIRSSIQTESSGLMVRLTRENMGIAFLGEYLVEGADEKNSLCILPVEGLDISYYTHLYYHKDKWLSPYLSIFIDTVQKVWKLI